MSASSNPLRRWWKSPRVRAVRQPISDLQVLLYPVAGIVVRVWVWLVHRFVPYDRRGPLYTFLRDGRPCIVALWHQDVFPLMFELFRYTPTYPCMFMVSRGRIGQVGTYFLNMWGMECIAGSSSGRGIQAVEELTKRQRERGGSIFLMADGSRGPAREARWGAVYLARDTGLPIVPVRGWGNNLIMFTSTWMQLVICKPWGRGLLLSGEPVYVAADADKAELDRCRGLLETRLNEMADAADAYFAEGPDAVAAWGPPVGEPVTVPGRISAMQDAVR